MPEWRCYAKPVRLGGRMCYHVNEVGFVFRGVLCCEECGCTKLASDLRRDRKEIKDADEMVSKMQGAKGKDE